MAVFLQLLHRTCTSAVHSHRMHHAPRRSIGWQRRHHEVELELKRAVLRSPSIHRYDRLMLFNVYILCHLLLNVAILPQFTPVQYGKLDTIFMRGVRLCVDRVSTAAEVCHDTHGNILAEHSIRSLQTFLDRRKLMFFLRLIAVECEVVRSAAFLDFSKYSMWPPMFDAMRRLRTAIPLLQDLPEPCEATLETWAPFVIGHHQEWTRWVHDFKGPVAEVLPPSQLQTLAVVPDEGASLSDWEDTAPLSVVLGLADTVPERTHAESQEF
eukprot:6492525-Amphidinium_carterae.1